MRATLLAGFAFALMTTQAGGQGTTPPRPTTAIMRGAVEDGIGGRLEGAEVTILGSGRVATTGARGLYRIDSIAPGKYWVAVRRIGYAPLRAALSFSAGQDRE